MKNLYFYRKKWKINSYISQGNNIWKYVYNTFHPYSPAFKGLKTPTGVITNHQLVTDSFANFYETNFAIPTFDPTNQIHLDRY
jgi:hypothetical protein